MKVNLTKPLSSRSTIWLLGFVAFFLISLLWVAGVISSPVKAMELPRFMALTPSPILTTISPTPFALPVECQNLEPDSFDPIASWVFGFNANQPNLIHNDDPVIGNYVIACAKFFHQTDLKGYETVKCPISGNVEVSNNGLLLAGGAHFDCPVNLRDMAFRATQGRIWLPDDLNYIQAYIKGTYDSPVPTATGENKIVSYDGVPITIIARRSQISTTITSRYNSVESSTYFESNIISHEFRSNISWEWHEWDNHCSPYNIDPYCYPFLENSGVLIDVYSAQALRSIKTTHNGFLNSKSVGLMSEYVPPSCVISPSDYQVTWDGLCYRGMVNIFTDICPNRSCLTLLNETSMVFEFNAHLITFGGGDYPITLYNIVFDPGAPSGPGPHNQMMTYCSTSSAFLKKIITPTALPTAPPIAPPCLDAPLP